MTLFPQPVAEMKPVIAEWGGRLFFDAAHQLGLIGGGQFQRPLEEGADIILVKPALPCLDLIRRAKETFGSPLAAYQVSGEYAMIKAAADRGMLDETRAMWESLYAIRRAGADIVLTYFAPQAAEALGERA